MSNTKKQHFVPQFYLLGFKADAGGLFAFDKVSQRVYTTTIRDAAQERNFYDMPESVAPGKRWRNNRIADAGTATVSASSPSATS